MTAQQNDVLDDSLLSAFAAEGHTEKDLKDDLAFLESADASRLADAERKRWEALKAEGQRRAYAFRRPTLRHSILNRFLVYYQYEESILVRALYQ